MRFSQRFPVRSAAMKQLCEFKCKDTKKNCGLQILLVKKHVLFSIVKRNLKRGHHNRSDVRFHVRYDVRFMLGIC